MADNKKEPGDKKEVQNCAACMTPCREANREARDRYHLALLNAHVVLDQVAKKEAN